MGLVRHILLLDCCFCMLGLTCCCIVTICVIVIILIKNVSYSEICWLLHLQYSYLCANFRNFCHSSWTTVCGSNLLPAFLVNQLSLSTKIQIDCIFTFVLVSYVASYWFSTLIVQADVRRHTHKTWCCVFGYNLLTDS
jgi:uncharacterized membrane protein